MKRLFLLIGMLVWICSPAWAAISCTSINNNENTSDNHVFATSSRTPTAGALQVFFAANTKASSPNTIQSITGDGLTFASVTTAVTSANDERISLWRAQAASTSTGALTIEYGTGNTQTHFLYAWFECTGTAGTNGNNGSEAFNSNFASNTVSSGTSLTVTLGSFAQSANGAVCSVALTTNTAISAGSGWTAMGTSVGGGTPNARIGAEYRADNDTTADMTFTTASGVGIAAELVAPTSATTPVLIYQQLLGFILPPLLKEAFAW